MFGRGAWKNKTQNDQTFPMDLDSPGLWTRLWASHKPQFFSCKGTGGEEWKPQGLALRFFSPLLPLCPLCC